MWAVYLVLQVPWCFARFQWQMIGPDVFCIGEAIWCITLAGMIIAALSGRSRTWLRALIGRGDRWN